MLFQIPKLYGDELAYSFLLRLSEANGFSEVKTAAFQVFHRNWEDIRYRNIRYDIHDDFYQLCQALGMSSSSTLDFYLSTSLFSGLAPLMTRAAASRHIGYLSKHRCGSDLLTAPNDMFTELRYCPLCMEEAVYYRRAHVMPGVTVCFKHGCRLIPFHGTRCRELEEATDRTVVSADNREVRYASFCHDFLYANLRCDLNAIREAVCGKVKEDKESGIDTCLRTRNPAFLKSFTQRIPQYADCADCLRLLFDVFENIDSLKASLSSGTGAPQTDAVSDGFELLSPFREDVIEVRCRTCGASFLTTPYRLRTGWGCPDCDAGINSRELFNRLASASLGRGYEILSAYCGLSENVRVRHKACGRLYDIRARNVVNGIVRCPCGRADEPEVRQRVEATEMFRLNCYDAGTGRADVCHIPCGTSFTVGYNQFFRHPSCPICAKALLTDASFIKTVGDLTGNEYTVQSCNLPAHKAMIRHNRCGTVQEYDTRKFCDGVRCRLCRRHITFSDFCAFVTAVTCGEYECMSRIDTETVILRHVPSGKQRRTLIRYAVQELTRPTPSVSLPAAHRDMSVRLPLSSAELVMDWVRLHRADSTPFTAKDILLPEAADLRVSQVLNNLYRAGSIERIAYGRYRLPHRKEDTV